MAGRRSFAIIIQAGLADRMAAFIQYFRDGCGL